MKQIFINLPVHLEKSMKLYTKLGFVNYPLFTFEDQKCMAWGGQILVMLQSKEFFNSEKFKSIGDTKKYLTPSFTLPVESISMMNEIVENQLAAALPEPNPMVDEGFMQVRTIEDLDGYNWGVIYLDMEKFKEMRNT